MGDHARCDIPVYEPTQAKPAHMCLTGQHARSILRTNALEERTMDSLIIAAFVVISSVYLLWQFLERGVLDDR